MKSRQLWITVGTAVISFVLGVAFASSSRKSETGSAASTRDGKFGGGGFSYSQPEDRQEMEARTRIGKREERKKPSEPRISLPLASVANVIREQRFSSSFNRLDYEMAKALPLLGATEQETSDIKALLKQTESEIYAAEKTHLKAIQTDATQIRLDSSSMESATKAIAQKTRDAIRSILPTDLGEVLISSVDWNQFYPTDEKSYPTLNITRSTSGKMMGWVRDASIGQGYSIDPKFADDGTPIPAEEAFVDERWNSFLKGLTLLPQNEK